MEDIAKRLVASGKGLLAVDDFTPGITRRLAAAGVPSTEESRRDYREMLFTTQQAMQDYVSGVILYDETFHQSARSGKLLREIIHETGALIGIKLDKGQKPFDSELLTHGLEDLAQRIAAYKGGGASFGKWRAVISISNTLPTPACIRENANALARYAEICQAGGIVPIVEPDILMEGTHDIERCAEVTAAVLTEQFEQLSRVNLRAMILKPNMVTAGASSSRPADVQTVADMTLDVLRRCVPADVAGIAFLSGGQSSRDATAHLNCMNASKARPWPLTFSYNRALHDDALKTWEGKPANILAAQKAFAHRARMNASASIGKWSEELEAQA